MRAHPIKWDNKILKNPVLNTVTAPPALFETKGTYIYVDLAYFTRRIQANSKMMNKNKFNSRNKTQSLQFSIKSMCLLTCFDHSNGVLGNGVPSNGVLGN